MTKGILRVSTIPYISLSDGRDGRGSILSGAGCQPSTEGAIVSMVVSKNRGTQICS